MFRFIPTEISDVMIIETQCFSDARGEFFEVWSKSAFARAGIRCDFVQTNHSISQKGVLRGMHFQNAPHEQAKLVRVVRGCVYDVAVDLRANSPHYGKWVGVTLSAQNKRQLFIPEGFAHGFLVLSGGVDFIYQCSTPYHKNSEGGFRYDDPTLAIHWPEQPLLVSEKDLAWPGF